MRQQNKVTPVLIVGGGPSGMTAALCLAECGIASTVIEKRESPARHPKAHEVSARTLEILSSLGVSMKDLIAESSPHEDAQRILFCRTINEELGRIDLGEKNIAAKYAAHTATERPYLNLSQTELEKILRRKVVMNKKITFLAGFEWLSLRQSNSGVVSCVQKVQSGVAMVRRRSPQVEIHSQYLICADGATGKCRQALGITMVGPEKIQDFANAYFTDDLRDRLKSPAKLFFIFKPDAAGTFIAHHAGRRWVYHVPVMTPHEKIEDYTAEVFQQRIARALGDSSFKANIESISSWRMTAQVASSFQKDRAFLVGDAAHRFPPTGGLGLNSGVADAHNLAWKIAAVLKGDALPALLESYESERKPVVTINCEESRRNYQKLFEIPAVLGLNAALLPRLMAVLTSIPFRWFGKRFHEALLRLVYAIADKRLKRYFQDSRRATRTRQAIQAQHEHFDRIGLDLGYRYSEGAIVNNGTQSHFSTVSEYRPAFAVGARLPVFRLGTGRHAAVSQEVIRNDKFTLFTTAAPDWRKACGRFASLLKVVPAAPAVLLAGKKQDWTSVAGGALLVRPDGHIAACLAENGDRATQLAVTFRKLGYSATRAVRIAS